MSINVIGISALYHDSACCLLRDGKLIAMAQEERFSRIKADSSIPARAFKFCLKEGGISLPDVDLIAFYEDPAKKFTRQVWSGVHNLPHIDMGQISPFRIEHEIRENLGYEGPIKYVDHHLSHGASSFFYSGFKKSAILTVDGVGEWATTTYGIGNESNLEIFEEVHFPDSLGLLYSTITSYLGFGVNDGEYKVMGLAPYGNPLYVEKIYRLVQLGDRGQYKLDMKYFDFFSDQTMYNDNLIHLLGCPAREEEAPISQFHKDIAKSLQVVLEEVLLSKVKYLHERTQLDNLCLAGGVALNCVANSRIRRESPFKNLFVQPAANDSGGALGAAAVGFYSLKAEKSIDLLEHAYYGPDFSPGEIHKLLISSALNFEDLKNNQDGLLSQVSRHLAEGKVIGWFHGKMEFGPRALGARSILADPRNPHMRDRINAMVKLREGFRPFAPAVLEEKANEHFDLKGASPFMLETCDVISKLDLPAITHVDNSARVQTVSRKHNARFAGLLEAFDRLTGCPILLNTSFNIKGEPIVCSPEDALLCFITTDIDVLVLEDFIIERANNSFENFRYINKNRDQQQKGIRRDVYTFI